MIHNQIRFIAFLDRLSSTLPSQAVMSEPPATDLTRWRLSNVKGRQTWRHTEDGEPTRESNFVEKHALGMELVCIIIFRIIMIDRV